ncbi:MAG: transposase [Gaiellaceae bacterium]
MPRPPRIEVPNGVYHVTANATHGNQIFRDDADRSRWLRLLATVVDRFFWECFAYCLLSTHYHLVFRIEEPTLARGMQYLNARYAESFNRRHGRQGHAFRARYYSILVETERHAMEVCRYVALNPVRAGLCVSAEAWPWSSFAATVGLAQAPAWLRTEWVLGLFADDPEVARRRFHAFVQQGRTLESPQGGLTLPTAPRRRPLVRRGLVRTAGRAGVPADDA